MPDTTARISVWVTPSASSDGIVGLRDGALHIRVSAPARNGWANAAVEALLGQTLKAPKTDVRVIRGHSSRRKLVAIKGLTFEEAMIRLGLGPQTAVGPA